LNLKSENKLVYVVDVEDFCIDYYDFYIQYPYAILCVIASLLPKWNMRCGLLEPN